jgi:hypothetical protein
MRLSSLEIAGVRSDPDLESGGSRIEHNTRRADIHVDIPVDIEKFDAGIAA